MYRLGSLDAAEIQKKRQPNRPDTFAKFLAVETLVLAALKVKSHQIFVEQIVVEVLLLLSILNCVLSKGFFTHEEEKKKYIYRKRGMVKEWFPQQ